MLARLACLLNRHRPQRDKVRREHLTYTGQCRHCGAPIVRLRHKLWVRRKG